MSPSIEYYSLVIGSGIFSRSLTFLICKMGPLYISHTRGVAGPFAQGLYVVGTCH